MLGFRCQSNRKVYPSLEHLLLNRKSPKSVGTQRPHDAVACPQRCCSQPDVMSPVPRGCWDPISCTSFSCTLRMQGEGLGWGTGGVMHHSLPTPSTCAQANAHLCLQAACSALARLLPPSRCQPAQCPFTLLGTEVQGCVAGGLHAQLTPSAGAAFPRVRRALQNASN